MEFSEAKWPQATISKWGKQNLSPTVCLFLSEETMKPWIRKITAKAGRERQRGTGKKGKAPNDREAGREEKGSVIYQSRTTWTQAKEKKNGKKKPINQLLLLW